MVRYIDNLSHNRLPRYRLRNKHPLWGSTYIAWVIFRLAVSTGGPGGLGTGFGIHMYFTMLFQELKMTRPPARRFRGEVFYRRSIQFWCPMSWLLSWFVLGVAIDRSTSAFQTGGQMKAIQGISHVQEQFQRIVSDSRYVHRDMDIALRIGN